MREQLTRKDVEKIEQEIEHRKLVVRKEAIEAVKEARAHGDLSENFEYHAAKKRAVIIDETSSEDEVGLNNTVTIYIPEDDVEEVYRLVTSIRGNSVKGLISIESPLGKAIRGHRVGDVVTVRVNDSYSYDVEIRRIENTQDEGDDRIRQY